MGLRRGEGPRGGNEVEGRGAEKVSLGGMG